MLLDLCHEIDLANLLFSPLTLKDVLCLDHKDFTKVDFVSSLTFTNSNNLIGSVSMDYLSPVNRRKLVIKSADFIDEIDFLTWNKQIGNNIAYGGNGNDTLAGGTGTDTVQFSYDIYNYTVWKGTNLIVTDKTSNRGGEDQLSSIETVSFNGTSFDVSDIRTGMYISSNEYQLIGDNQSFTLRNKRNTRSFNDDSSNSWNVIAAKNNSSSFQVLVDGTGSRDGQNEIWTTNANGVFSSSTAWLTDAQAVANGYESTFNVDINNNGLIGS